MTNTERRAMRTGLLAGTAAIVLATAMAVPQVAHAQSGAACGPLDETVVCAPAGNPYPAGIAYRTDGTAPDPVDLTVVLQDGVNVAYAPQTRFDRAVSAYNGGDGAVTVRASGASIATTGANQYGIGAGAYGGGAVRVEAGRIATAGRGAAGVFAFGYGGDITVRGGTITTTGAAAAGLVVQALGGSGAIEVTSGAIGTRGDASDGIQALHLGDGPVSVTVDGAIAIAGSSSRGVSVSAPRSAVTAVVGGDIVGTGMFETGVRLSGATVDLTVVGSVAMSGTAATAINATAQGAIRVAIDGTVSTGGTGSSGVVARSTAGAASLTGTGSITGAGGASLDGRSVRVDFGSITTERTALLASSSGPDGIDIRIGTAAATGANASGIDATAGGGAPISITAGSVRAASNNAVYASTDGRIDIDVGDARNGLGSTIAALGGENHVIVRGTVISDAAPDADTTFGVIRMIGADNGAVAGGDPALAPGSSVLVNDGMLVSRNDRVQGVRITGPGDAIVSGSGAIATAGAAATGLYAKVGGAASISVGDISVAGDGASAIDVEASQVALTLNGTLSSSGAQTVQNGVVVSVVATGTGGDGAPAGDGNVSIVNNGTITSTGVNARGIGANATGNIAISGTGSIATGDAGAAGIFAIAAGDVSAAQTRIATRDASGVIAVSTNGGAVDVAVGSITVNAPAGNTGLHAGIITQTDGHARLTAGSIATSGGASNGVLVLPGYVGTADVALGSVTTTGNQSNGIFVSGSTNSTVNVAVSGTIETFGNGANGVYMPGYGPTATITTHDIVTHGDNADGMLINPAFADVTVLGSVRTSGINSVGLGVGCPETLRAALNVTGDVTTQGSNSTGVGVFSYGGAYLKSGGTVTTSGDNSYGVRISAGRAFSPDGGKLTADINAVVTTGEGSFGVMAVQRAPQAAALTIGSVATGGDNAFGVDARQFGAAPLTVDVGSVTTSGTRSVGVSAIRGDQGRFYATRYYGNVDVTSHSVTTTGDRSNAVQVVNFGYGHAIAKIDNTATAGAGSNGVLVYAPTGLALAYADNVTVSGYGAHAVAAYGYFAAALTSGTISSTAAQPAADGSAIIVKGTGIGTASLSYVRNEGRVVTSGTRNRGILVNGNGKMRVYGAGVVETNGTGATGVKAYGGGSIAIAQTSITAADATAIYASSSGGGITVEVGTASAHGTLRDAIFAQTTAPGAGIAVKAGTASASGDGGRGIFASLYDGNVTINAGTVTTDAAGGATAGYGISVIANGAAGTATIDSTAIATRGDFGRGIAVVPGDLFDGSGFRTVNITVGDITTDGNYADAIVSQRGDSNVVINGAIRTLGPNSSGAAVGTLQPVTTAVTLNGAVETFGDRSKGLNAIGGTAATVTAAGPIVTHGLYSDGVAIDTQDGDARATIATIATAGQSADGIQVRGNLLNMAGAGTISVDAGTIVTQGANAVGIKLENNGIGDVTLRSGQVTTSGDYAHGITVRTGLQSYLDYGGGGGKVDVQSGSVATTGDYAYGIDVRTPYGGAVQIASGAVTTAGAGASAIVAFNGAGPVGIAAHDITTTGANAAAISARGTAIDITVDGTVSTAGDRLRPGTIRAIAFDYGAGTVRVTNNGSITSAGAQSDGITANADGAVTIANNGGIATTGAGAFGLYLESGGGIVVWGAGTIRTTGDRAVGILAQGNGAVSVTQQRVSTTGNGAGAILALGSSVSVSAGVVAATGAAGANNPYPFALGVAATSGDALIEVGSVTGSGAGVSAIGAQAAGAARIAVAAGGAVSGAIDGIRAVAGSGVTLTNAGTVTGGAAALRFTGSAAATIANSGTIAGRVLLTDMGDTVTNVGTVRFGGGSSFGAGDDLLTSNGTVVLDGDLDFGAGNDRLVNNGTLTISAATSAASASIAGQTAVLAAAPRAVNLLALETFANAGTITLANGTAGDVLTTQGNVVGSGNSRLLLDVNAVSVPTADRLVVSGAATGSTTIVVNYLNAEPVLSPGVTLVQAGAGTSAGAFTLAPSSAERGLVGYGLVYDAAATRFTLVGAPNAGAFRLLKVGEGALSLAQGSADAVSAQLDSARDAGAGPTGLWLQMFGKVATRDERRTFDSFGLSRTVDSSYRQDAFGGQAGFGFGGERVTFGITGGYQSSKLNARAAGDRFDYDAYNIGGYVAYTGGPLFVNALAKYDRYQVDPRSIPGGYRIDTSGDGYTGRVEAGARLGSGGLWIEPKLGLSYVRASIDGVSVGPVAVDFADADGLRGTAGVRVGGGSGAVKFYAAGDYVHEFEGTDGIALRSGTTTIGYRNAPVEDYGRGKLGVTIASGPIAGFIEGEGIAGSGYTGGGARVGVRFAF